MSFQTISAGAVAVGLLALAGVLYLLQRLRVRHEERVVVTTLFWKEAVEETRARVFIERFRHPLAYLLALAIGALLWLAAADPQRGGAPEREVVLLLDGSAGMAFGTRFAAAGLALREELESLPSGSRRVILCADEPRTLLLAGEEALLLEERLRGIVPAAAPACVQAEVLRLARQSTSDRPLEVLVFGDAPLDERALALLPGSCTVRRVERGADDTRAGNRGVTALGVSAASSGAWNRVDVLVEVRGPGSADAPLSVLLAGEPWTSPAVRATPVDGSGELARITIADLPAAGGLLTVRLDPDAFTLDDEASILLPERPMIRVALSPSLDATMRPALAADPAVVIVDTAPDLVVRRAGEGYGGEVPALEFAPASTQVESILVRHSAADDSHAVLAEAFEALGLAEVDAMGLAEVAARPITVGAAVGSRPGIGVWEELLEEEYNFTRSRAFPLFVAGAVRWLAGEREFLSFVAAGEPVAGRAAVYVDDTGAALDPLGTSFTPPRAGRYDASGASGSSGSAPIVASLLDVGTTVPGPPLSASDLGGSGSGVPRGDPVTWLALAALLLLCVEWTLHRTGRMP